jgi:HK97 gp10 family phage protein
LARLRGFDALRQRLSRLARATDDACAQAAASSAAAMAEDIRRSLSPSAANARVSAPGEPPASHSGRLRRGVRADSDGAAGSVMVGPSTGAPYAAALEFGTRRMAARPFILPAVASFRARIAAIAAQALRAALTAFARR